MPKVRKTKKIKAAKKITLNDVFIPSYDHYKFLFEQQEQFNKLIYGTRNQAEGNDVVETTITTYGCYQKGLVNA